MSRFTLRTRLIGAAAAAMVAAVAALGLSASLLVAHQLHQTLDATLRARAANVAQLAVSAPAVLRTPGALDAPYGGRELSVEVLTRSATIYARSLSLGANALPSAATKRALNGDAISYANGTLDGSRIRLFAAPLANFGGPASGGAVLVASSTADITQTLQRLHTLVAICALAAGGLGGLLTALLMQRGLRPLRRLSDAAAAIARNPDGSQRLPPHASGDEVGELTSALNGMLEALDRARATERRFLADASHELRTPLTSLRGNAAYVAAHGGEVETLRDIEADAERLGRLLDDLLALEREEGAQRPSEIVSLSELVYDIEVAAEQLHVSVAENAEHACVLGERGALHRALSNLVQNAAVHGPAGGRIDVRLRVAGDRASIEVSDQGGGVDPADARAIFRRFWRGSRANGVPGSGLGLSIVASTARRHGGRIEVQGSRFTLELPIVRASSQTGTKLNLR